MFVQNGVDKQTSGRWSDDIAGQMWDYVLPCYHAFWPVGSNPTSEREYDIRCCATSLQTRRVVCILLDWLAWIDETSKSRIALQSR